MPFVELSQVLGNLGEFIGSLAVVATLIYLAVQVRYSRDLLEENRRIALGQASQTNAGYRLEMQRYIAQPHIVEIREKVEQDDARYREENLANFDKLNVAEKIMWRSVQAQWTILVDESLYQSSLGLVADRDREVYERTVKASMRYWDHYEAFVPPRLRSWYDEHKDE